MAGRVLNRRIEGGARPSLRELQMLDLQRGYLGRFFGTSTAHMGLYVAVLCIILSFAVFVFAAFGYGGQYSSYGTSLLTFAGGLFGGRAFK